MISGLGSAGAWPLRKALLYSLAAHLLIFLAGGFRMVSVVGESGVAGKNLQLLQVSLTRAPVLPAVAHGVAVARVPAVPRPISRASVLATADAALTRSPGWAIESLAPDGLPPASTSPALAATPVAASAAAGKLEASREEVVLPDGYLDAVRGYRIALALQAKRFRVYPPAAREMGIGGRSEIEIIVPAAAPPEFRVRQSSGHEQLDRAALEMLQRSVEQVEFPIQLMGRRLAISLPVEFLPTP